MADSCRVRTYGLRDTVAAEVAAALRIAAGLETPGVSLEVAGSSDFEPLQVGCFVVGVDAAAKRPGELLERLALIESAMTVVYLVETPQIRTIVDLVRRGAAEVLEWPTDQVRFGIAVERALALSLEKHRHLIDLRTARKRCADLSSGEVDVLNLVLGGAMNKVIANQLNIAVRTVEARRHRIFATFGTRSLPEIADTLRRAFTQSAATDLVRGW